MQFLKYNWKPKYDAQFDDIVCDFFIPALEKSRLYRRFVESFSSSIFEIAAVGIAKLITNGGKMELLIGANLSKEDAEAINNGTLQIDNYVINKIPINFEDYNDLKKFIIEERWKALYWLIAKGRLEIKIALDVDPTGQIIYNQDQIKTNKNWGYFSDQDNNQLGFKGLSEESKEGWENKSNYVVIYEGWEKDKKKLLELKKMFSICWDDHLPNFRVYSVTTAVKKRLIKYKYSKPPTKDPFEHKKKLEKLRKGIKFEETDIELKNFIGLYYGMNFLSPEQFISYIKGQIIGNISGLDHSWNSMLQTITFKPMEHQIIIANEIYNHFPRSYLLCDEVGLGKTIEAGLAIKWLYFAGKIKRILLILPKNIIKQWQEELREKFNMEFLFYDGKDLISYWNEHFIPQTENPYNSSNLILVSSGLLRKKNRAEILLQSSEWDLILFDEAHHLRRKKSGVPGLLLKLAQELQYHSRCFLFLTATPIQLDIIELFDLLKLLNLGGKWGIRENFTHFHEVIEKKIQNRTVEEWKFLVSLAHDFLNFGRINQKIYEKEIKYLHYEENTKYHKVFLNIFIKGHNFESYLLKYKQNNAFLSELSNELESLTPLRWYMFRNTRPQLQSYEINIAERKPKDISIKMNEEERNLYKKVEKYIIEIYNKSEKAQKTIIGFTLAVYRRRLTSSFAAIKNTLKKRIIKLEKYERMEIDEEDDIFNYFDDEEIDEDLITRLDSEIRKNQSKKKNVESHYTSIFGGEYDGNNNTETKSKFNIVIAKNSFKEEIEILQRFIGDIEKFLETGYDSKFHELLEILKHANKEDAKRVLIFTQYTDTLNYLKEKLKLFPDYEELGCYSGKGGEKLFNNPRRWVSCTKEEMKKWFFEESQFKIMLCTDAAAEGLNFQICNYLINYDLPWNPMKIEQRIGRIDRVKQQNKLLFIYNLLYTDTIEGRIYSKLWERIRTFTNIVGPLQPILNVYQKAEEFAISEGDDKLDEEEIELMLYNIKNEIKQANSKQDFFLKLLHQRTNPDIEEMINKKPFITKEYIFKWIKQYFISNLYQKFISPNSTIQYNITKDYIKLYLQNKNFSPYFTNPNDKIILKKFRKHQSRDLHKIELELFLTSNLKIYDEEESSYFLSNDTIFYNNLINSMFQNDKNEIHAIFSENFKTSDEISKVNLLVKLELSLYPMEYHSEIVEITIDLSSEKVLNFIIIEDIKNFYGNLSKNLKKTFDEDELVEKLKNIEPKIKKLNSIIESFLNNFDNNALKKIKDAMQNTKEQGRWDEYKHDFTSQYHTHRINFLKDFKKWLILEYLNQYDQENLEFLPKKLKFQKLIKNFVENTDFEDINDLLKIFDVKSDVHSLEKDSIIVKEILKMYKNKKKFLLLKADQGRIRKSLIQLYKSWKKEEEIFKIRQNEYKKFNEDSELNYKIIGLILFN